MLTLDLSIAPEVQSKMDPALEHYIHTVARRITARGLRVYLGEILGGNVEAVARDAEGEAKARGVGGNELDAVAALNTAVAKLAGRASWVAV